MGYRIAVHGEVLNVLRWTTASGDARQTIPPDQAPGPRPRSAASARRSSPGPSSPARGSRSAHLDETRFTGYRTLGTLTSEVVRLARAGEPFVYAYYEGLDKVSHEYGLGAAYDEELRWIDHLVATLLDRLPAGTVLVVTADHGQVEVPPTDVLELPGDLQSHVASQSGEGRFRWLHARGGRSGALLDAAHGLMDQHAWVRSREEAIAEGWYGPVVTDAAAGRLGDVLLAAKGTVAFVDPARHRPLRPDRPARIAHRGRDARPPRSPGWLA